MCHQGANRWYWWLVMVLLLPAVAAPLWAGELSLVLEGGERFELVGLVRRWDELGLPLQRVNPKARIDAPELAVRLEPVSSGRYVARDVPDGVYDLCLVDRRRAARLEGFHFPPIIDFDPIWRTPPRPPAEAVTFVCRWIQKSRFYENKVTPLCVAGNDRAVRVFVQLLRDAGTTYDAQCGAPVATLRYEFWQFTNRLGVWDKERRNRVIYRLILPRAELARWQWLWCPRLGGIEVKGKVELKLTLPSATDPDVVGLLSGLKPLAVRTP